MKSLADNALRNFLLLCAALVATALLYWPGLSGPLMFDDYSVLTPVEDWHAGKQGWQITLLPNSDSIVASRPVAMASFLLTTWIGGVGTFPLKLGNLLLHLLCGLLGGWLLHRVLQRDRRLAPHAALLAVAATALWWLHPLHVSTVLYAVQRMAQLATLFTLAAVALYLIARQQLIEGRIRPAVLNLFLGVPLLVLLGVLSKQNAAIAGFLCLVLELAYFQQEAPHRRVLQGFFGLFVALPTLAVAALLALAPERLLGAYAEWDFTVWQRLLTQPRALFDYIGMWFLPRGPQMGLYTDAYPVSTSLLAPPTTLLAILALVAISGFAIAVRKRAPSVFAGWCFFLVAHAVESSFLPLEMYYEHRNYLPSFGLLLMACGLATLVPAGANSGARNLRKLGTLAAIAFALVLAFATLGRVLVWQHDETIIAQGIEQHPDSLRAHLDKAALAWRRGDYAATDAALRPLLDNDDPRQRLVARMDLVVVDCARGGDTGPQELERATTDAQPVLTVHELHVAMLLEEIDRKGLCAKLTSAQLAGSLAVLLNAAATQPDSANSKSTIRRITVQLYSSAGLWTEAERHAQIGWNSRQTMPFGVLLAQAYIQNGKHHEAARLLDILDGKMPRFDDRWSVALARLRSLLKPDN